MNEKELRELIALEVAEYTKLRLESYYSEIYNKSMDDYLEKNYPELYGNMEAAQDLEWYLEISAESKESILLPRPTDNFKHGTIFHKIVSTKHNMDTYDNMQSDHKVALFEKAFKEIIEEIEK